MGTRRGIARRAGPAADRSPIGRQYGEVPLLRRDRLLLFCEQFGMRGGDMKINVTWADIKHGKSGKPTECMVALALKRELGVSYATVGFRDAGVVIDGQFTK